MVDNIILDTLTNPTLAKGASPLISTKVGERDGTRGGGQPDGQLYDMNRIQYLGSFAINAGADTTNPENGDTSHKSADTNIGFRPPNGSNGVYGSIMLPFNGFQKFNGSKLTEVYIPETLSFSSDHNDLALANPVYTPVAISDTHAGINPNTGTDTIGWAQEIDGRLFMSIYGSYDADAKNDTCLAIYDNPDDLLNSTGTGFISTSASDFGVGYASPIPPEYQSVLGGTWMMGSGNNNSILSRFSQGPAIWSFNPSSVSNGDASMSATVHLNYPYRLDLSQPEFPYDTSYMLSGYAGDIDGYNEGILKWYVQDQLGYIYNQNEFDGSGDPILSGYLEYLASSPRIPFDTLEPPPASILNDLWNYFCSISLAFIVPGTRTLMCVGSMGGRRYGGGYKAPYLDGGPAPGGQNPVDRDDLDHWYWLFDMDDILSASTTYEPRPYARGVWDNNRWLKPTSTYTDNPSATDRSAGRKIGGFFDQGTGRLYLSTFPHKVGFWDTSVVSVYQIV